MGDVRMLHGGDEATGAISAAGSPSECLSQAWLAVAQASAADRPRERYELSALAAVRAAAAVVAFHRGAGPTSEPHNGASVWALVTRWTPELREWADFFATVAEVRSRLGRRGPVGITQRLADDMLRDADRFVHEVRAVLLRRRTRVASAGPHPSAAGDGG